MDAAADKMRVESSRPTRSSLRHKARIVFVIASSDFKLKYADSALGYVWSLAKPLGLFGMLYIVFREALGTPEQVLDAYVSARKAAAVGS